jgi:hypothetical protein
LPALQIAEGFCLPPLHAEKVGGARHVDIQKGSAHEEIGRLGRDVLGELRQSLGGDNPRKPAFAATAHQIRHGAEREFTRLVRNLAGDCWRKELRLIHHHQHRVPVVAGDLEQPVEEGGGAPHLVLGVEPLEIEHRGDAMDARSLTGDLQATLGMVLGIDQKVAETIGKRHEVAFGIDDGLLHPGGTLFQQPAQQMGFAGARIALHQQAGRQQFLKVQSRRGAGRRVPHLDRNSHVSTQSLLAEAGLTTCSQPVERPWPTTPCSPRLVECHQPDGRRP